MSPLMALMHRLGTLQLLAFWPLQQKQQWISSGRGQQLLPCQYPYQGSALVEDVSCAL